MNSLEHLLKRMQEAYALRQWDKFHSPKNLVMDLASETGELVDPFRWITEAESYDLPEHIRKEVQNEIGDVMKTLVYLSYKLGIDPVAAAHEKLTQMDQKYPVELCQGKADKYTAYTRENSYEK